MAKTKRITRKIITWRDFPDSAHRSFDKPPSPESLHPSEGTIIRAVSGYAEARAILDSYAFRFPVTMVEHLND